MAEGITRQAVVDASLELLADGGLHALAMRRIAGALGVQQSALYWYFENKQQILAAVADQLLDSVEPVPAEGDWRRQAVDQASQLRAELLRYPDGAELVATSYAFRLGAERPHRQFAAVLGEAGAGLAPDEADIGATVLLHFVLGFATDEQQRRQAAALGAITDTADAGEHEAARRFVEGVRVIVAGIEARSRA